MPSDIQCGSLVSLLLQTSSDKRASSQRSLPFIHCPPPMLGAVLWPCASLLGCWSSLWSNFLGLTTPVHINIGCLNYFLKQPFGSSLWASESARCWLHFYLILVEPLLCCKYLKIGSCFVHNWSILFQSHTHLFHKSCHEIYWRKCYFGYLNLQLTG